MRTVPALILAAALPAAEPVPPQVVVVPEAVRLSYQVQFDEQGRYRRTSGDLSVELGLKPANGVQLLACRGITLTEAVTDSGESLRPRSRGQELGQESFNEWERTNNNYDVSMNLSAPARAPQAIARIAGTIRLAVISGTGAQGELRPFKEWVGKPLLLEGMDQPITVTVGEGPSVRLAGPQEVIERIDSITARRGDGRDIQVRGWGSGSDNDEWYRSYNMQIPDDGALVVRLLPPSTEVQVPFSLGPLPMSSGAPAATAPVRVPAPSQPAEGAKPKVAAPERPAQGAGGF
ncbi:MAG: hypothetical protein RLZZ127_2077 [Planctomycetota bacterium]|jgi:hypothetical protein